MDDLGGARIAVKSFKAAFPLLYTSDDPSVPELYGVWNLHHDNKAGPSIFLIDKRGGLAWRHIEDGPYRRIATERVLQVLEDTVGAAG